MSFKPFFQKRFKRGDFPYGFSHLCFFSQATSLRWSHTHPAPPVTVGIAGGKDVVDDKKQRLEWFKVQMYDS